MGWTTWIQASWCLPSKEDAPGVCLLSGEVPPVDNDSAETLMNSEKHFIFFSFVTFHMKFYMKSVIQTVSFSLVSLPAVSVTSYDLPPI